MDGSKPFHLPLGNANDAVSSRKGILNARLYDSPYFGQWETAVNKMEEILARMG